jgi:hypothetical protein
MTVGKAALLTAGFVGAVALGVAVGPSVMDRMSDRSMETADKPAAVTAERASAPAPAKPRAKAARTNTARPNTVAESKADSTSSGSVSLGELKLHDRLKPVLTPGARMEIAAAGFRSAEEFATVAHASRNTKLPFMVLKHRVLNEQMSLAQAISESKPELDAKAEVKRAQAEARSDIDAIVG